MSTEIEQAERLAERIRSAAGKGKTERALIYEELRHHALGPVFTVDTLTKLADEGKIRRVSTGPKRFRSVSSRERNEIVRYFHVDH